MSPSFFLVLLALLGVVCADTDQPGRYKFSRNEEAVETLPGLSPKYSTQYMDIVDLGGIKYFFSNQIMSWMESLSFCMAFNMDLASIETSAENDLIEAHLVEIGQSGNYFWASGNKIGRSTMMWLNGANLVYDDFQPGHPGNYICMQLRATKWWGANCEGVGYPICEQRAL